MLKKWLLTLGLITMVSVQFVACGSKENNKNPGTSLDDGKKDTDKSDDGIIESEEDTIDQFAKPVAGEVVAELVIKDYGSIHVKFFEEAAPKAVENFVTHAKNGYYDGIEFHRVIEDFMIQGGDPTATGRGGESIWGTDFEDEFHVSLHPYRGALCMANAGPMTNGSQFFIVQAGQTYTKADLIDSMGLTLTQKAIDNYATIGGTPWLYGAHTVFGQVYEGLEVVDAIAQVEKIDPRAGVTKDQIVIETIHVTEYEEVK